MSAAATAGQIEQRVVDSGQDRTGPDVRSTVARALRQRRRRRFQEQVAQLVQVDGQADPTTADGHRRADQERPSGRAAQPPGQSQDHGGPTDFESGKRLFMRCRRSIKTDFEFRFYFYASRTAINVSLVVVIRVFDYCYYDWL